ncbi:hypothetical protein ACWCXH_32085 [Kitasatospora sp. NPDC001660]
MPTTVSTPLSDPTADLGLYGAAGDLATQEGAETAARACARGRDADGGGTSGGP